MAYKGIYKPTHPKKYADTHTHTHTHDPNRIIYRSNWERKFMVYCDRNDDIVYWASEELIIPYYNPVTKKFIDIFPTLSLKLLKASVL